MIDFETLVILFNIYNNIMVQVNRVAYSYYNTLIQTSHRQHICKIYQKNDKSICMTSK